MLEIVNNKTESPHMLKKSYIYTVNQALPIYKVCDSVPPAENFTDDGSKYLKTSTAHNMIKQFLLEKKMSKEELAEKLGLTAREFDAFNSVEGYKRYAPIASYKLLCLYCRTKWHK
jgi:hypothetical protein